MSDGHRLPTYVTIGGFLGAGKTTAMLRLAELLTARGLRVGLVTNDQSGGLVDTANVAAHGYPVREVADGCFCCRFGSLIEAAESLAREARPEVFLAEPVGSCTDLRATVQIPLARLYGDAYRVAPLSVLVDPLRAARALGVDPGPSFSSRVLYVYEKQLEEAEILLLNKIDIIPDALRAPLVSTLARRCPRAEIRAISARTGVGIESWLDRLLAPAAAPSPRPALEVDYDLYAEGESLLGWLNSTVRIEAAGGVGRFDGDQLLLRLADALRASLASATVEVAHLKLALEPADAVDDRARATLSLVRTDGAAEVARRLERPIAAGVLTINLRAEDDPERLHGLLATAIAGAARAVGAETRVEGEACFRPGRPVPTHRMEAT